MAIGPESGEEANRIWTQIEQEKKDLDDLIGVYKSGRADIFESGLTSQIRDIRVSLQPEPTGILAQVITGGQPLHITRDTLPRHAKDFLSAFLKNCMRWISNISK